MGNNQCLEKFSPVVWARGVGGRKTNAIYNTTIRVSSEIELNTRRRGREPACRIIVELCQNIFASSPNDVWGFGMTRNFRDGTLRRVRAREYSDY